MALKFEILKKHNKSRLGKLHTKHGIVNTPAFMTVGTCRNRWNRPGLKLFWVIHITLCCGRELIWWKKWAGCISL